MDTELDKKPTAREEEGTVIGIPRKRCHWTTGAGLVQVMAYGRRLVIIVFIYLFFCFYRREIRAENIVSIMETIIHGAYGIASHNL